jgi:hypothetical protein
MASNIHGKTSMGRHTGPVLVIPYAIYYTAYTVCGAVWTAAAAQLCLQHAPYAHCAAQYGMHSTQHVPRAA